MIAAVGTARVTFPMVVVMITPDIGVEVQLTCCQRTMAAAARIHNLRRNDISIFHIIDFELFGVAEVLKYTSVFVSYCDSHNMISFRFFVHRMDFWAPGCGPCS